jgi:hypothetical protein
MAHPTLHGDLVAALHAAAQAAHTAPPAPRKVHRAESEFVKSLLDRIAAAVTDEQRRTVWEAADDNEWGLRPVAEPAEMTQTAAVLLDRDTLESFEMLDALVAARILRDEHWDALLMWAVLVTQGGKKPNRAKAKGVLQYVTQHATSDGIVDLVRTLHEEMETHEVNVFREFGLPRTPRTQLAARRGLAEWQMAVGLPHELIELDDDDGHAGLGIADYAEDAEGGGDEEGIDADTI